MADCNFTMLLKGSVDELLAKARQGITAMGGNLEGDTSSGSFTLTNPVSIAGSYTISGMKMDITISEKPFFVSCSMIEKQFEKLMNEQNA
jgi:hypothetical protein